MGIVGHGTGAPGAGVLITRIALLVNTSSNTLENRPSRSLIKNANRSARSPKSISRFRACWAAQAPVGFAVTP